MKGGRRRVSSIFQEPLLASPIPPMLMSPDISKEIHGGLALRYWEIMAHFFPTAKGSTMWAGRLLNFILLRTSWYMGLVFVFVSWAGLGVRGGTLLPRSDHFDNFNCTVLQYLFPHPQAATGQGSGPQSRCWREREEKRI